MKKYDGLFDTDENKALLAICARKLISNIGIGGVIWGLINIVMGAVFFLADPVNAGIVVIGVMMLGVGIRALKNPTLGVLLTETLVTVALLVWNVAMAVYNVVNGFGFDIRGIIFPTIVAAAFYGSYRKLQHIKEQIASVETEKVNTTKQLCKALVKKKLKDEPTIVETNDRRCRAQLLPDRGFFIQRDMMRAFVGTHADIRRAIVKPDAKSLKMTFQHPLGKLAYKFNRKNSDKLRNWLAAGISPADPSPQGVVT